MKVVVLDMLSKRISTMDADPADDPIDGVLVSNYGTAAGTSTAAAYSAQHLAVGSAAGSSTAAAISPVYEELYLEPLWIYPWATPTSTEGRPVHSLGDTTYSWASWVTTPTTSSSFQTIADAQADQLPSTEFFRIGGAVDSRHWMGSGWFSSSTNTEVYIAGGATLDDDPQYVYAHVAPDYGPFGAPIAMTDLYALDVPLSAHTPVDLDESVWAIDNPFPERYGLYYRQLFVPGAGLLSVPAGYDPLSVAQTPVSPTPLWSSAQAAYALRVKEERVPHHPLTDENGHTWVIETGTAKQLAAIEYRAGVLYQNAVMPVVLPGDSRYNDADWWERQRIAAIEIGLLKPDVTSPVTVTSWARRTN